MRKSRAHPARRSAGHGQRAPSQCPRVREQPPRPPETASRGGTPRDTARQLKHAKHESEQGWSESNIRSVVPVISRQNYDYRGRIETPSSIYRDRISSHCFTWIADFSQVTETYIDLTRQNSRTLVNVPRQNFGLCYTLRWYSTWHSTSTENT